MEDELEDEFQGKSKSQVKREAEALQRLGEELANLPRVKLERMELPQDLRRALIESQSIKSNIAARRQRQYIGALMRGVDPEAIRRAMVETDFDIPVESKTGEQIRVWLDRLSTGEPAVMEEFLSVCPGLERQRLRQLVRNIAKEKSAKKSAGKSLNTLKQLIVKSLNYK